MYEHSAPTSHDSNNDVSYNDSNVAAASPSPSPTTLPDSALSSLPLFADSFSSSADFSAVAALIEEEEDEQRKTQRVARDETKLRRKQQRMDVETEVEVGLLTAAPASTTRLHRAQRRQAAQPYSREPTRGQQSGRSRKINKPKPIQPLTAAHTQQAESGQAGGTVTAAEATLFMQMWHIDTEVAATH